MRDRVPYTALATDDTPALVIYVLDISGSMLLDFYGQQRIHVVSDALDWVAQKMVSRSMHGSVISPRYHVAIIAYNDQVTSLGGIQTLPEYVDAGIPVFEPSGGTNTREAFEAAEELLKQALPHYVNCPAPLVCHVTDGAFTTKDPTPVAKRIMSMSNIDGYVLIENVFISDELMHYPPADVRVWNGINSSDLTNYHARALLAMSSPLPASMADFLHSDGYSLEAGVPMMIPAQSRELVQVAFAMSGATDKAS